MNPRYRHFTDPERAEIMLNDESCISVLVTTFAQQYPEDTNVQEVCKFVRERTSSRFHYVQTIKTCTAEQLAFWNALLATQGVILSPRRAVDIVTLLGNNGSAEKMSALLPTLEPFQWSNGTFLREMGRYFPCYHQHLIDNHLLSDPLNQLEYVQGLQDSYEIEAMHTVLQDAPIVWDGRSIYEVLYPTISRLSDFQYSYNAGARKLSELIRIWDTEVLTLRHGWGVEYPQALLAHYIITTSSQHTSILMMLHKAGINFKSEAAHSATMRDHYFASTIMQTPIEEDVAVEYTQHADNCHFQPLLAIQYDEAIAVLLASPTQYMKQYGLVNDIYEVLESTMQEYTR